LYAQAQRVTVVRTSTTVVEQGKSTKAAAAPSANDQALAQSQQHIQRLDGKIATLMKQLSDSEEKTLAAQSAAKHSKVEVADAQKSLSQSMITIEALRKEAAAATAAAAAAAAAATTPTASAASAMEQRVRQLEERLEVEIGVNQRMFAAVMGIADNFGRDGTIGDVGASALSGDSRNALEALTAASRAVAEQLKAAGAACSGMKREQDDVLSRLAVLQKEHGYLLAAHEETKVELLALRAQQEKFRNKEQHDQTALAKVQADGDELNSVKGDLSRALARAVEAEKQVERLSPALREALANLSKSQQELEGLSFDINQVTEELNSYKTLAETLKAKMRDMGGKDTSFFDSFEEVMRDEMAAMKWAFEAKLRVAKEKADAVSVKHQQELQKLREAGAGKLHAVHHSGSAASFTR
jgi:chromosome segregation ATPase